MQLQHRSESFLKRDVRPAAQGSQDSLDLEMLFGAIRRQWRVFALCAAGFAALGVIYAQSAVPLYTADISVLVDDGSNTVVQNLQSLGVVVDDEEAVLSQIELLQSQAISAGVVDQLKLVDNPVFMSTDPSLFAKMRRMLRSFSDFKQWFSGTASSRDIEARKRLAAAKILDGMNVSRVGKSYVLDISYTATSAELAAQIANAIGDVYLRDKLESKYESTRRASAWLQDRLAELRTQSLQSDLAVQKFRASNGLVSSGSTLISDQQLQELNSSLIVAQADTAKARARDERIKQILENGDSDAIVTDVLESSVSNELRKKYLEAAKTEAQIAPRLGENHEQVLRLKSEMAEYKRLMFDELRRLSESYSSDLSVAVAREKNILDSLAKATTASASAGETHVQLRELERNADTYRTLYQTFLDRYQNALQQQSFPVSDSRTISGAQPPDKASFPRKPMLVILFVIVGGALGIGIGAFREFRDRFFRTGDQIRDVLGLEFLGTAPIIKGKAAATSTERPHSRVLNKVNSVTNYVVDNPLSSFAETLRGAKIAVDLALPGKPCRIIGIVSTVPGEGKTTIAVNFAEMLAKQGARTVLMDADLRNPGATRAVAPYAESGLLQVIMDDSPVRDLLVYNPDTKLAMLPAVIRHRIPHSSALLTSAGMQRALTTLSEAADYIVIDLPPLSAVVDARALAPRIDGFIYVTEWGSTTRKSVLDALQSDPHVASKCVGAILNKVDYSKLKLYKTFGSMEHYYPKYAQYYRQ